MRGTNERYSVDVVVALGWRERFLASLENRSVNTAASYVRSLVDFERWFLERNKVPFSIELANRMDFMAYRDDCLNRRKLAGATWNLRLATLHVLCRWAADEGLLPAGYDPLDGVVGVELVTQPRWLDDKDFARLLRQMELGVAQASTPARRWRALRDSALVGVMLFAGLRVDEAANLRVADVVLGERSGKVVVRLGKGDKRREVPLCREARRLLGLYLTHNPSPERKGESAFFVDDDGMALSVRGIQKRVARLGAACGLAELTPHMLRHTCAKRMVDGGRPITEVQLILGHAKIETTARYCQPGWGDLERAVETIF